jgi:hypothetical protein
MERWPLRVRGFLARGPGAIRSGLGRSRLNDRPWILAFVLFAATYGVMLLQPRTAAARLPASPCTKSRRDRFDRASVKRDRLS